MKKLVLLAGLMMGLGSLQAIEPELQERLEALDRAEILINSIPGGRPQGAIGHELHGGSFYIFDFESPEFDPNGAKYKHLLTIEKLLFPNSDENQIFDISRWQQKIARERADIAHRQFLAENKGKIAVFYASLISGSYLLLKTLRDSLKSA